MRPRPAGSSHVRREALHHGGRGILGGPGHLEAVLLQFVDEPVAAHDQDAGTGRHLLHEQPHGCLGRGDDVGRGHCETEVGEVAGDGGIRA